MHIEIQVALNFVISYLYNKLPRRRVNIFGEELEKALRDKFQGHWYPEKPFKGSAYRCLKTGDAIDSVLERAARESGVPISDVLENLPHELSVWMDPGEVSFRVGEKGAVKILYTENNENHEDSRSADREVTKTFNPEAQCFRPIDVVNTTLTNLSLSPKSLPVPMPQAGSSPHSAASGSPTYKGSPNPNASNGSCGSASGSSTGSATAQGQAQGQTTQAPPHGNTSAGGTASAYLQRAPQAPLTFTTATFAQTKFGSTKLKTSSKRASSSAYRMSPTEFSNYIKQRAIQQQMHHGHGVVSSQGYAALDPVSPARSISPNPLALGGQMATGAVAGDHFFYPGVVMGLYPPFNGQRNLYESHFNGDANMAMFAGHPHVNPVGGGAKYSTYMEACYYPNGQHVSQQQQLGGQMDNESCTYGLEADQCNIDEVGAASVGVGVAAGAGAGAGAGDSSPDNSPIATPPVAAMPNQNSAAVAATTVDTAATAGPASPGVNQQQQQTESSSSSNLIDGINSFYGTGSSYQQLLVAN